ncbi:hypothetical protein KQY27_03320 [Methanobrevibacter sp. TMH8]|uniref:hypothetical protein n=1 Tax=Methanobrevibacter sp. TMH8 TaxID=2848611 RepID=UPI001CCB22A2|nr:hypothetical protein [Methanobrevibacter sp. TMH8]MBZ9570575.1 hypothetical protein [Methanobrevibacter sp. TMH8]
MGIKELREKFHGEDAKFSSHFHNTDENGIKKPSWGKIIVAWLITIIAVSIIVGTIYSAAFYEPETSLHLNSVDAIIGANETNYTIMGTTDVNASLHLSSNELKLKNVSVTVDSNGNFKYSLNIPQNVTDVYVELTSVANGKTENTTLVHIERPTTSLSLDDVNFTDNDTSLTVSGKTDPNAQVTISSSDLDIENISLTADSNGLFSYQLSVPNDENNFEINVESQVLGKKVGSDLLSIVRALTPEPVPEPEPTIESDSSSSSSDSSDTSAGGEVIITATGSKYHSHVHGNMKYIEYVSLSYAKQYYEPCKVCY